LVHPLTDTRLPALTHTSACATPDGCIATNTSGTAVNASTPTANAAHVRLLVLIVFSLPLRVFPPTGVGGKRSISALVAAMPVFGVDRFPSCAAWWDLNRTAQLGVEQTFSANTIEFGSFAVAARG
jgi:hypothetical protein